MSADPSAPSFLVTGANGFIGSHLVEGLRRHYPKSRIMAGCRGVGQFPAEVINRTVDLTDGQSVAGLIEEAAPDVVLHLAGQASVGGSFSNSAAVWDVNVDGTRHLALALRAVRPDASLIFASSAEVYGASFGPGDPLKEDACLRPMTPYARTKLAAEMLLKDCFGDGGKLVILRLFNHLGPGQTEEFVAASFAAQLARLEKSDIDGVIQVGDLSARRDFGDVQDGVAAFLAVVEARASLASGSVFNVCSGEVRSVRDLLNWLISRSHAKAKVEVVAERLRKIEIPCAAGSCAALTAATGWRPRGLTDATITSLLNYWRDRSLHSS